MAVGHKGQPLELNVWLDESSGIITSLKPGQQLMVKGYMHACPGVLVVPAVAEEKPQLEGRECSHAVPFCPLTPVHRRRHLAAGARAGVLLVFALGLPSC